MAESPEIQNVEGAHPSDPEQPPSYDQAISSAGAENNPTGGKNHGQYSQHAAWMTPSTSTGIQYPRQEYHSPHNIEGSDQIFYGQYSDQTHSGMAPYPDVQHITIVERTSEQPPGGSGSFKKDVIVLIYSILAGLFCCLILGIVALIYSISAFCIRSTNPRKADAHTDIALKVSNVGVVCGLIIYGIVVIGILIVVT